MEYAKNKLNIERIVCTLVTNSLPLIPYSFFGVEDGARTRDPQNHNLML